MSGDVTCIYILFLILSFGLLCKSILGLYVGFKKGLGIIPPHAYSVLIPLSPADEQPSPPTWRLAESWRQKGQNSHLAARPVPAGSRSVSCRGRGYGCAGGEQRPAGSRRRARSCDRCLRTAPPVEGPLAQHRSRCCLHHALHRVSTAVALTEARGFALVPTVRPATPPIRGRLGSC